MGYKFEKNYNGGQDIVIENWEKGIAPSPYAGINDIRAVNVSDIPGAVFANAGTSNNLLDPTVGTAYLGVSKTFTANTNDQITITGITDEWKYTAVAFTAIGTLASTPQIVVGTTYYLKYISSGIYKVSTTYANAVAGTFIDITTAGTGTQTLTSLNIGAITATSKDDRSGNIYAIDNNARVWCSNDTTGAYHWTLLDGNTRTNGNGNGIAVWQNYVFAFRNTKIDVFGPLNSISTATWTNDWQALTATSSVNVIHKTFVASNNILYWTDFVANTGALRNPGYIGSLGLTSSSVFNPADSNLTGSYNYNFAALDFPDNEQPVALSELNSYLIIGVNMSGLNVSGSVSKLYYWDTTSASFQTPLIVPESPIYEIINANNIIYIFCGWRGRVYKTNLSSMALAFKVPDQMYIPASSMGYEGLPLFGTVSGPSGSTLYKILFANQARVTRKKIMFCVNVYGSTALYSYDAETGILQIDAKSLNGYGSSSSDTPQLYGVEVLSAQSTPATLGTEILFFGLYYNGSTTTYTIEQYNPITKQTDANFGSYNGLITTDFINVGSFNNKKTFEQLEYVLDRNMVSGSGLKIYYRTKIGASWTLLATEDYTTLNAASTSLSGRVIPFSLNDVQFVQLQITFNPYTVLRQIRLR